MSFTPLIDPGGDPTDCMYNGDVDLTSDALQSFEGAITASGAIRITGTTPINPTGDLILEGDIIILDAPINTNGDLTLNGDIITLNPNPFCWFRNAQQPRRIIILDPNQVTTIIDIATAGTTPTPLLLASLPSLSPPAAFASSPLPSPSALIQPCCPSVQATHSAPRLLPLPPGCLSSRGPIPRRWLYSHRHRRHHAHSQRG